jgi:GNAT superfamily N-acetyltransferase
MPNDPWTIRDYVPADAAACRACVVELQEAERRIDARLRAGEVMADAYLRDMHARCAACAGAILVAEVDGDVAGLVMVLTRVPFEALDEPPGEYALVAELVVREGYRRRGLGAALLRAAEGAARAAGASELRIGVLSGNRAARRLYGQAGFGPYVETLTKSLLPRRSRGVARRGTMR